MTTCVLLIRHGQTDWNVAGRWQGHTDVPLNRTGQAQAQALAARLADWPIVAVYSSDLRRAAETAAILAAATSAPLQFDPAWRERDVGPLQGLTREEVQARFPHALADGAFSPLPGVEDNAHLQQRAAAAFERLLARHQEEMVAVVSHGGTLNRLLAHVLGLEPGMPARLSLRGNTGLSIVEAREGHRPAIILLNDTGHLPAALGDAGMAGKTPFTTEEDGANYA